MGRTKLNVIEFRAEDITAAIVKLQELNQSDHLAGLLFIAKIKGKKKPVMGAAGCCLSDPMLAMGAAVHLLRAVTDMAVHE